LLTIAAGGCVSQAAVTAAAIEADTDAIVFRMAFDRHGVPPDRMLVGSETPGRQYRPGGQD